MNWQLTPWWLRLIGKPKWRVEGFGGFWFYASKPWDRKQAAGVVQPATLESERDPRNPNRRVLFLVPGKRSIVRN